MASSNGPPPAAFYCVADERYFLGAVGLVNSLRLQGHREPIYLLDAGLSSAQRGVLTGEVTVVEPPEQAPPWLLKTVAPLAHLAETMVLIDADMIVTRPLTELIERAAGGRIVAFYNNMDRHCPEWGELVGLGPIERGPYLCSGFVAMARDPGEEVLRLVDERRELVDFSRTLWRANEADYPFLYADQDVFNAVVAARVGFERVDALDHRLATGLIFDEPELLDASTLRCRFADGLEPYLLHNFLPAKPWLKPMYDGVYSRLLKRLLVGPDLAIRIPSEWVPMRFRGTLFGRLERKRVDAMVRLGWHIGMRNDRVRHRLGLPERERVFRG